MSRAAMGHSLYSQPMNSGWSILRNALAWRLAAMSSATQKYMDGARCPVCGYLCGKLRQSKRCQATLSLRARSLSLKKRQRQSSREILKFVKALSFANTTESDDNR